MPVKLSGNLSGLFETAYANLFGVHEKNEYIYKNVLTSRILLGVHSLKTTTVVPEFCVGAVKADFAIFNGTSTVYEIKTERVRTLGMRLKTKERTFWVIFKTYLKTSGRH